MIAVACVISLSECILLFAAGADLGAPVIAAAANGSVRGAVSRGGGVSEGICVMEPPRAAVCRKQRRLAILFEPVVVACAEKSTAWMRQRRAACMRGSSRGMRETGLDG